MTNSDYRVLLLTPSPAAACKQPPEQNQVFGGDWPASWVALPEPPSPPFVAAYWLTFALADAATVRFHVTADERYEIFLDGRRIGRGSERGDPWHWFFETYDVPMAAGEHRLVARVWSLGDLAPLAQLSVRHGFLLCADGPHTELLSTGVAAWQAKRLSGYAFRNIPHTSCFGASHEIDATSFDWDCLHGKSDGWAPAVAFGEHARSRSFSRHRPIPHDLVPATLPAMLDVPRRPGRVRHVDAPPSDQTDTQSVEAGEHLPADAAAWAALANRDVPLTVPPNSRRRVIFDLDDYCCAYPAVTVSGGRGARVRLRFAEHLSDPARPKTWDAAASDRDLITGRVFEGFYDVFLPDGHAGRTFELLWWRCGRYMELYVETAAEAVTINRVELRETRYPLKQESRFASSDPALDRIAPIMVRSLQMCAHETYMDCPYWEQLMYVGDTRLEVLVTYAISRDSRLPRKAVLMFDWSRDQTGLTRSSYPVRRPQRIGPFSLWWVAMVHDYALWRGDEEFIRGLMPGVRAVIEAYLAYRNADGLIERSVGWNFMDWVRGHGFANGVPPGGSEGVSGMINWQFALVLGQAAELERAMGESELAARCERLADETADAAVDAFWDDARGLLAEDAAKQHFTEHSQCLALLTDRLAEPMRTRAAEGLFSAPDLARCTYYFSHYYLEACRLTRRMDAFHRRMGDWYAMADKGLKTTPEVPDPTRSDCHAWSAHPLFHYFATILGIRPAAFGFRKVLVEPQPGPLTRVAGTMVHPAGEIAVELTQEDGRLTGTILLPPGTDGILRRAGADRPLRPGRNDVSC